VKRLHPALSVLVLLLVVLAAAAAFADEGGAPPAEPLWKGSLGLAYLATSGNSDTQTFGLDFNMTRRPDPWGIELKAAFNRASDSGNTTAERYLAAVRGSRAFNERWQAFAGLSGEKDTFSGYDLLAVVETGVTYNALLGPVHTLSFDLGLTYTDENRVAPAPNVNYMGAIVGLGYAWKLSDTASFTERLDFFPNFKESNDWRLSSATALQAALNKRLAVKIGFEVRYRNQPIDDLKGTDTTSTVSLVVNL
jgi:putative salt-induced outer membrane protein